MDLYARKVVGWAMSPRMKEDLTKAALDMALRQRRPTDRLVHHSDRGRQGEFKRSSQHLHDEELRWNQRNEYEQQIVRVGCRCNRRVARRCGGASTNSYFGKQSVAGYRVKKWPAYRRPLGSAGSVKGVGWQPLAQPGIRVAICRLASEKKSRSYVHRLATFGRSPVG
jgi:hypothetical protein